MRNVTLKDAEVKTATTTGPLTNGFTRFTYRFTTGAAGPYELALQNDTNATAKDVIFWGAMLNQGGTALDYEYAAPTTGGSAPAPAYAGFGDAFGGVTAYYSLRQFTEAETLNAIRVRRSSDDAEQDIGFDANGDLDTTALLAFVGTGGTDNGFVSKWYDQSGNGNDATNATASQQPLIVDSGTLVEENSKAAIEFNRTTTEDILSAAVSFSQPVTHFFVRRITDLTNSIQVPLSYQSGTGTPWGEIHYQSLFRTHFGGGYLGTFASVEDLVLQYVFANGTNSTIAYNGAEGDTGNAGTDNVSGIHLGRNSSSGTYESDIKVQELIIFNSDQSGNRGTVTTGGGTGIEGNINTYFDIV